MEQKIVDFYEGMNLPIGRMIFVGVSKKGLSSEAIRRAAEDLYNEIQCGRNIPATRIAWEIFGMAKHTKGNDASEIQVLKATIAKWSQDYGKQGDEIQALRARIAELESPWYKKLWRALK